MKSYQIIILGSILSSLFILNSNNFDSQKLNNDQKQFFNRIISKRFLQEDGVENLEEQNINSKSDIDKVCEKGSEELIAYYKTGDFSKIGLDDKPITCKDKNEEYIQALKKILKKYASGGSKKRILDENVDNEIVPNKNSENSNKEEDGEITDAIIVYTKNFLPLIIFLVIGILSIPGWLFCCFCCCCNCCCCCCCKKTGCKIPCFIFTYIFYLVAIFVCIYGLTQSNQIFKGIADTECSFLRFVEELLDGETKEKLPKWAGIEGIISILDQINGKLENLEGTRINNINQHIEDLLDETKSDSPRNLFLDKMKDADRSFYEDNTAKMLYNRQYSLSDKYTNAQYLLDIIQYFGHYDPSTKEGTPKLSVIDIWVTEYNEVSKAADTKLGEAKGNFNDILGEKFSQISDALNEGKNVVGDFKSGFQDIKDDLAQSIIDYSEIIDTYGKKGFKYIFYAIGIINIVLAIFITFLCCCSGKTCTNCCCCRCFCKFFIHLFWNTLALLMITTFLVGFLFTFIGQIGSNFVTILSYAVSEDNIGEGKENFLIDQLEEAKNYIDTCVNGNGDIMNKLGIDTNSLKSFDGIKEAEDKINDITSKFDDIKKNMLAYKEGLRRLTDRWDDLETSDDFGFILQNGEELFSAGQNPPPYLKFKEILTEVNKYIKFKGINEEWTNTCQKENLCSNDYTCYHPKTCLPLQRGWIDTTPDLSEEFRLNITILNHIKESLGFAASDLDNDSSGDNPDDTPDDTPTTYTTGSYSGKIKELKVSYEGYLKSYIDVLTEVKEAINEITEILKKYTGDKGGLFSFVNCNFIGKNLKIILKYLENALGTKLYTVGICLFIVGCSLALSISSTILLIVIINIDIDNNNRQSNQIPEYSLNSARRVFKYQ